MIIFYFYSRFMAILLKLRPKNTKIHLIKERKVNNKIHFVKKHLYKFHFRNNPIPFPWKQKFRERAGEGKDGEGRYGKGKAAGRGRRADRTEVPDSGACPSKGQRKKPPRMSCQGPRGGRM